MGDFSDSMSALAGRLIDKFGEDVSIESRAAGTYSNLTYTPGAATANTIKAGIVPIKKSGETVGGTPIETGDLIAYVQASDVTFEMKTGLHLEDGEGKDWTIKDYDIYRAQGVTIAYRLLFRALREQTA